MRLAQKGSDTVTTGRDSMDCSVLMGSQLVALKGLAGALQRGQGLTQDQISHRELCDRGAAHFRAREQIMLPALQRGGWKGLNNEALAAHVELKRALAALCVTRPGEADFPGLLRHFAHAVEQQQLADELWILPSLRRVTTEGERRRMCKEIEQLYAAMVPPESHYLEVGGHRRPGDSLIEDATVVLSALGHPRPRHGVQPATE